MEDENEVPKFLKEAFQKGNRVQGILTSKKRGVNTIYLYASFKKIGAECRYNWSVRLLKWCAF
jgi:hypothetical protein